MESKSLNEMKASEVYRITAAVLEIIEKAQFKTTMDAHIQEAGKPERWKMVFTKDSTNLDELNCIRGELGKDFSVNVTPKDKTMLVISIEASTDDFKGLIQ